MCDYCAWGLWDNEGRAIDYSCLKDEGFPESDVEGKLEKWQNMYESFNFYQSETITRKEMQRPEFKVFQSLGDEIYAQMLEIVEKNNLPFVVVYDKDV